jgi:tellurite resistance protein TerA
MNIHLGINWLKICSYLKNNNVIMSINLNKVVLQKSGDTKRINLAKDNSGNILSKEITINLNWTQEKKVEKPSGFFGSLSKMFASTDGIDLDLGCFYELRNGTKMVIDGLQFSNGKGGIRSALSNQGRYTGQPWIWHSGDDRSGTGDGENILLNPTGVKDLKRLTIYCFIYKGVANWAQTNAIASIKVPGNPDIVVEMGQQINKEMMCALAEINFEGSDEINVKKLVTFHNGHAECDRAYNWGLQWKAGSK